ncbi:MAG: C1 family peptidase, partial [Hyphomicrobiaceae bacterium]
MTSHKMQGRLLDARPDRIDFRDKLYQPPLISLPSRFPRSEDIAGFLPKYHRSSKILDQGTEGACTGFGLAAVINYIVWDRWMRESLADPDTKMPLPPHVSPWMLYDNARVYDEWEGEDYSGSSCRGAMKGWHKHGVCRDKYWKRRTRANPRPDIKWRSDAALRPLGSYYRVNASSISDMQSAIHEVRAVYCSARVHKGWMLDVGHDIIDVAGLELPIISRDGKITGGHAFAVVGYTEHGFIVQNSWGEDWGVKGFALVAYA